MLGEISRMLVEERERWQIRQRLGKCMTVNHITHWLQHMPYAIYLEHKGDWERLLHFLHHKHLHETSLQKCFFSKGCAGVRYHALQIWAQLLDEIDCQLANDSTHPLSETQTTTASQPSPDTIPSPSNKHFYVFSVKAPLPSLCGWDDFSHCSSSMNLSATMSAEEELFSLSVNVHPNTDQSSDKTWSNHISTRLRDLEALACYECADNW